MTDQYATTRIIYYNSDEKPYGLTYGQWTVEWWRWAMSIPKSMNPVFDKTGRYAAINQPNNVWFLAGRFAGEDKHFPQRHCTIPSDRSILFPIINCEANLLEYPRLKTEQDLLDHVSRDMNSIIKKECFVNGERISSQRVQSDPKIFTLSVNVDLDGLDKGCQDIPSTADGYWVFLRPLSKGQYNIRFAGACENGRLNSGASYEIIVI